LDTQQGVSNIILAMTRREESRPQELPLQPLAERYMNLSIHTAPIRQTHLSFQPANVQTSLDID